MEILWRKKLDTEEYSARKITISGTFGVHYDKILCYERNYETLDKDQIIELLKDARENKWDSLDLSNCGLKELPDELWNLHSLKVLYLGNRAEKNDHINTYLEISEKIGELTNLEALSICNITDVRIPKALKQLPQLRYLDCFGCCFTSIPNNLINKNIRAIGIECSNTNELSKICKMKKLEEIFLSGSKVKSLPIEMGNLTSLKGLHLVRSEVEMIPESLLNLKELKFFNIAMTPLAASIPEEMKKQSPYNLISFICRQQNQQETYFFNESKMIIVGQGNVGKSCLLDRITNNIYKEKKDSTEGIDVKRWVYNKNKKEYTLNIWDFGGQEIYHSTHQFFLTKRSLYIFVWDAREEEEYGRIDYWLKTIESFAEDSPIIICINKCDKNTTRINRIDFKEYKEKYPQIQAILDISCKDNINIKRLRTYIVKHASALQITKEKWLKSWYDVREEIEKISDKKYITYDEYKKICFKHNVGVEEGKSLSQYLHDLGVILHYQNDTFLKGIVILSPEWATSAVYKILDSQENVLRNRNGVLKISDLPLIWKDFELYPEDKHIFLLKIMEKFQLCYELNKESYLVAELLENTSIECPDGWDFNNTSCIRIQYSYDFIPAGIMTRFIVNINEYIAIINGKSMCWRKGVYLIHKTAYASVIMRDSIAEKKIEIKVNARENSVHARELLYTIRKTIDEINCDFKKINVEEFVPCNCEPECQYTFAYSKLCKALDKKVETMQCYESFKQVNVLKLLEGIDIMKPEETGPYSYINHMTVKPVFTNNVSSESSATQSNVVNIQQIRNIIMEIQGDIVEIQEDILDIVSENGQEDIKKQFEKINMDLESISEIKTPEGIVKSGKLNKLKRWLTEFSDEGSEIRKALSGAKNVLMMVKELAVKVNGLLEKLGISLLPPF